MDSEQRQARALALGQQGSDTVLYYLRLLRVSHSAANRMSEVYELARKLLDGDLITKEAEFWSVQEDYAIACIELGKTDEALSSINKVMKKFPESCRALRLKGMYLESVGKAEEARVTYERAMDIDPANLMTIHRIAALKKGQGNVSGALDELHEHLETQPGDYQAWYEAGKLHARQGAFSKAAFCFEEVLMHHPADLQTQLVLADCLYACGGVENIRYALKYYSSVVELTDGSNVKSLMGVCQCTKKLGNECDATDKSLGKLSMEALLSEYVMKGGPWSKAATSLLCHGS
jgi:tetratricopeptide (TPR) repeat protein